MSQTVTFTKVFKAEGTSQRGPWVRWDYKTEDGGRFPHFAATQEIPLDTLVQVQTSAKGDIREWQVAPIQGAAATGQQQESSGASQAVSAAPVASQAPSERDKQIHRQTAAKVAAQLLQYFPKSEQGLETFYVVTENLVGYFASGDTIPF